MGSQKPVAVAPVPTSRERTVSSVISTSKSTRPSTMTRPRSTRPPSAARRQAAPSSSGRRTTDWPWPEEDMTGLTTHGNPTRRAPAASSSGDEAKT